MWKIKFWEQFWYWQEYSFSQGVVLLIKGKKLEVLHGHCRTLNRPYEQIEKTTLFMAPIVQNGHLDPAALDTLKALAELGIDEVMVRTPTDPATFDLFATELIPLVEKIPVAGR